MQLPSASPQGIAAAYMGNPGALQKKVQKDQQAHPGLPPDLKNLMALNIVTNEQDAAKRQQAMNALNQMAPAGQQPPTVAQSIQEQAKQKMQAQMLQQQRQQQGLMSLAQQHPGMQVPERTPQPEQQPQGIDELPVEMSLAGGGIVAFAGGEDVPYETRYDRMNRENREREARELADRTAQIRESGNEAGATTYGEQMRGLGQAIDRMVPDPMMLLRKLVGDPSLARETADPAAPQPAAADRALLNAAERAAAPAEYITRRAPVAPTPSPAAGLRALAAQKAAVPAQAAPTPAATDPRQQALLAALNAKPEDAAAAAQARAKEAYGAPDTSQYDRLVAELEGRKKQFNAPQGMDALVEYARQYGQGPRWYEQGQKAGAAQVALDKERQAQQFELTKQGIETAQKKLEAERGYKKELFGLGEKERDAVEKHSLEAAKEIGLDARNTATLANHITVAKIQAATAASRIAGAETLTANQRVALADKAADNVAAQLKGNVALGMQVSKNPALLTDMITRETARLLAAAEGRTMAAAPGAASPGGTSTTGWGKAQVVK